ncbi:MAG: ATPase, T2SS/T4P/T4SS family [Patescibacteria group bacterium]
MNLYDPKVKEILIERNYIDPADMKKAEIVAQTGNITAIDYLISKELITRDLIGQAIAESFFVQYADLNSHQPSREQALRIPEDIARKFRVVLFKETKDEFLISTDDPSQVGLGESLKMVFGVEKKITLAYSLPDDINASFVYYKKALETRFASIIKQNVKVAPEIIGEIIEDAATYRASDIHFEPQEQEVVIRFRIDGVLQEAGRIPKEYYENILNRIKIQGHMRTDEHFSAQDGSLRYKNGTENIDMRISVIPIMDGEKIAIRLLSEYVRGFTLGDLGLSEEHQNMLVKAAQKPFGMILVTGPTGSGKTTTLYSLIKTFNTPEKNITTIEDPIEYKITGINQIQVNEQTNLTFSEGLRSIVRQDPDIILVGEIRDNETADIAVNAALTGHLLFSTFHANDAATAIPRLFDMKVEPFLLASTLELIIAQRLVRKICEACRFSIPVDRSVLEKISPLISKHFEEKTTLYKGKGCPVCNFTGYKGRTGIFEFIHVTPEIKDLVMKNPSAQDIWSLARTQGSKSLFEDGIEKVKAGITTVEELLRVSSPSKE